MGLWVGEGKVGGGEDGELIVKDDFQVYFFKNGVDGKDINGEWEDGMRSRFSDRIWKDSKFGLDMLSLMNLEMFK